MSCIGLHTTSIYIIYVSFSELIFIRSISFIVGSTHDEIKCTLMHEKLIVAASNSCNNAAVKWTIKRFAAWHHFTTITDDRINIDESAQHSQTRPAIAHRALAVFDLDCNGDWINEEVNRAIKCVVWSIIRRSIEFATVSIRRWYRYRWPANEKFSSRVAR